MDMPNVSNPIQDSQRGVIYDILAYRTLTHSERVMSVRHYLSQQRKKPKRGTKMTIVSIIGYDGSNSL
jgi:hypothetical protein